MNGTTIATEQRIVSFTSEGECKALAKAVQRVTEQLEEHLKALKASGKQPTVVSVSQSSGYIGHVGMYASLTAVINQ